MELLLKNRKVLITGGSQGIGLACAKAAASEGADIIISSRSPVNLEKASEQITLNGGKLFTFSSNLAVTEDIDSLYKFVLDKFGYLDGLILNGGGPPIGSALEHSDEVWMSAINSLLMPVVRLTRLFIPGMAERNYGRIISISTTGVKQPINGLVLSNSIRQAIAGYLKTLSNEVASKNIYINSLLPGSTNTERLSALHKELSRRTGKTFDEVVEMRKGLVPANKFGDTSDIASLAAFLLSEKNGYITGQTIAVDGGMVNSTF